MDDLTPREIVAEYRRECEALQSEYEKVREAEWDRRVKACEAVYVDQTLSWDEFRAATDRINRECGRVINSAWSVFATARLEAWNAMADKTSDPLVRWIIDNCWGYREEAIMVLDSLPASMEDLHRLAANSLWCGVWDEYVAKAEEDGVI